MAKGLKTGGRQKGTPNKNTANSKASASEHGPEAIREILVLAKTAENETTRLAAWRELLDRGYGKPPQYAEIGSKGGAPLTLVIETGVPARAIEPPTIDITPDAEPEPSGTYAVPIDAESDDKPNDNKVLDNKSE